MTNLIIGIATKPSIQIATTSAVVSVTLGILGWLNPWLSILAVLISIASATLGFMIKYRQWKSLNTKK